MKKNYLAVAIAAMMFTGCSNVELEDTDYVPESAQLSFASVVTANLVTRADSPTPLKAGFVFNLTGDTPIVKAQAVEYTEGTGYTMKDGAVITLYKDQNYTLSAWAPADLTPKATTDNVFTMAPGLVGTAKDLVYCSKPVSVSTCSNMELAMDHAMAKFIFKFTFDSAYPKAKELSSLIVKGLSGEADFNIADKTWTAGTAAPLTLVTTAAKAADVTALVIPGTGADLKVDCTIDGTQYQDVVITGIPTVEKGTQYTITLSVTGSDMSVSSVMDNGWTEGNPGSGALE